MKKLISLKWEIGKYLLVFSMLTVFVVFVFQILLLGPMYETNKINNIKSVAHYVEESLESEQFDDFVTFIMNQSDTCVSVYTADSSTNSQLLLSKRGCLISSLSDGQRAEFIAKATESEDHTYLYKLTSKPMDFGFGNASQDDTVYDSIIYTMLVDTSSVQTIIMVSGTITPINATTQTLMGQMWYIGAFLILSITILTIVMYRHIAKPIIGITNAAKDLPKGEYTIDPKTNRYAEAAALNETLDQAAKDIHKADKAKRDLISNVSHDLRTPLTMIGGYGEMMIDLPEEKTDENIQVIVDETKRLNALVNDLLDMSRLQDERIKLEKETIDLSLLLKTQLHKYEVYQLQEGFNIESYLLDSVYVDADKKRIEQVFNNFMNNAVNYGGDAKHIIVRETLVNDLVKVEIQDFGEGIDEADLDNIWDRYYKVDKEHVRVSNGSGIGLNIVKQLLDLHGAQYGVTSKKDQGSTFWFAMRTVKEKSE